MSKAVENGVIKYLSPSAISAFNPLESGCNRRWYARYVLVESFAPNASAALGTKIHSEIEHYLRTGENVLGSLALAAQEFLPAPKSVQIEQTLKGLEISGIPIEGRLDVLNLSQVFIDSLGFHLKMSEDTCEILDWKSTSNIAYAKVGKALCTTQMILYALWVAKHYPDKRHFYLSQVFISTRGKKQTIKNFYKISLEELNSYVLPITSIVDKIKKVVQLENISQVEPNWDSCNAFSGCPYRHHCNQKEETKMGLLDLLTATQNGVPNAPVETPKKLTDLEGLKASLLAEEQQVIASLPNVKSFGDCAQCGAPVNSNNGSLTPTGKVKHLTGCKASVVPPDANRSELPKLEPIIETPKEETPKLIAPQKEATAIQEPIATKRGRPQGSKNLSNLDPTAQPETKGFTLYVNCFISGMPQNDISIKITQIAQSLADKDGSPDIRCSKNPLFAFGAWKGALAAAIREEFSTWKLEHLSIAGVSNSDFKQIAVEVLESMAVIVIRGV